MSLLHWADLRMKEFLEFNGSLVVPFETALWVDTWKSETGQKGRHFADGISKYNLLNAPYCILWQISLYRLESYWH